MRYSIDAAVLPLLHNSLSTSAKANLGMREKNFNVAKILTNITHKYTDTSDEGKYKPSNMATRIKMRRKISVHNYIKNHRILRSDILHVECKEFITDTDEKFTITKIINRLRADLE